MFRLKCLGMNLAWTPALACRSNQQTSLTLTVSRCYSLLRSTPTFAETYQWDGGVQRNKMVTTCSKNMSSLPSVMRTDPWAVACNLANAFHQQGQVRFKANLEIQSVGLSGTKLVDNHNVQEVALSEDERNRLQAELELLEAYIQTNMEGMRGINKVIDGIAVELEAVRKAITLGKQCLNRLTNDNFDEVLGEFPQLELEIQDLRTHGDKPQAIKAYLANKEKLCWEKERMFYDFSALLTEAKYCNALGSQLADTYLQSSINVRSSESSLTEKEPNPKRKQRWIELNEILQRIARQSMTHDSKPCPLEIWSEVQYVFNPTIWKQPSRKIDDEKLDVLDQYLCMIKNCFGLMILVEDAKRLHFIAPILFYVCNLFDGDVDIVVEKDVVGNFVKAQSHFEFMLRRGNKAVCIVLAKKEDIAQATIDALVGCEVMAEVEGLDIVYGIATDYVEWSFLYSFNDKVEWDFLDLDPKCPKRSSLKGIVERIYSMLSGEDTQG